MKPKINLSVLFIVQAGKKFGIGHAKRAIYLSKYYINPLILVISDLKDPIPLTGLFEDTPFQIISLKEKISELNLFHNYSFDLIISDCAETTLLLQHTLNIIHIPIISFDNELLGLCSEIYVAPFPSYRKKLGNFNELYYSPIEEKCFSESFPTAISKILISIGGSDPHCIAEKIVKGLKESPYKITVICGQISNYNFKESDNIKIISHVDCLCPYIEDHDLIFCGPGLTLLETMAAQKYVIAIGHNHEQMKNLASLDGIYSLKPHLLTGKKIRLAIENATIGKLNLPTSFNFSDWWVELSQSIANRPAFCPLCGSYDKKILVRNEKKNQFLCNSCQSTYHYDILISDEKKIDSNTFIASNVEQSQQSYKELVLKQKEDSARRIQIIKKILPVPGYNTYYNLLDIGCEQGIFVQEASHNGFSAQGVELSDFPRRLARDNNIKIIDSMEKVYDNGSIYDVITIWKKLEFLADPASYLKEISSLINVGGILAFRIPTVTRMPFIKGCFRITPKGGIKLAEQIGFTVVKTNYFVDSNSITFIECYCIKKRSKDGIH